MMMATPQLPQQQFVVLNSNQMPGANPTAAVKVKYTRKVLKTVKVMTLSQLAIGVIIFICQAVTTAINEDFITQISRAESQRGLRFDYTYGSNDVGREDFLDHAATGIWVGLLVIITAAIGLGGIRRQSKGLIITHLIFNVFMIMVLIPLIVTVCVSIQGLMRGRYRGIHVEREDRYSYDYSGGCYDYPCPSTTTTTVHPISVEFYGEDLNLKDKDDYTQFHCSAPVFRAWMALDAIILVAAVFGWIMSFSLLIYNSKAACKSCCCRCCRSTDAGQSGQVAYYAYPQQSAVPNPGVQYMVQPTFIPPQYQYQQPTMMFAQPSNNPPVQYVSQMTGPSVPTSQSSGAAAASATTHQPEQAVSADQPPQYTELEQNSANLAAASQRAESK